MDNEHFLLKILETTPNLIYIYDLIEHRNTFANKEVANFLGYTPDQIKGMGPDLFKIILHPEDAMRVAVHHARFNVAGDSDVFEIEYRMKNSLGEWRWLHSRDAIFSRTVEGKPKEIIGSTDDITERKRAIELLTASENKLKSLFGAMKEVVLVNDKYGVYTEVIETNPSLLFKPSKDLLGKSIYEIFPKDKADFFFEKITKTIETQKPVNFEYDLIINNKEYWFDATLSPLDSEKTILVARDITEKKTSESRLRESENYFKLMFNESPIGAAVVGLNFRFMKVNKKFCDMVGYAEEELIKLTFKEITHPDNAESDLKNIKKLAEGEIDQYSVDKKYLRKDGAVVWGHVYVRTIKNSSGVPIALLAQVEDVSKVIESETKYRELYESMSDAYVEVDMEGKILKHNKAYENLTGYSAEELSNLTYFEMTPKKWHDFESKIVEEQILKKGESAVYRKEYIKKDGTLIPIELKVSLIRNKEGLPSSMWSIVRDVSSVQTI